MIKSLTSGRNMYQKFQSFKDWQLKLWFVITVKMFLSFKVKSFPLPHFTAGKHARLVNFKTTVIFVSYESLSLICLVPCDIKLWHQALRSESILKSVCGKGNEQCLNAHDFCYSTIRCLQRDKILNRMVF